MKKIYVSFLALMSAMMIMANAAGNDAAIGAADEAANEAVNEMEWTEFEMDSVAVDENDDVVTEELYVIIGEDTFPAPPKPEHLDMREPRRAALAATCYTDSIVGLDTLGNYVSKEEFEYDAAGHTINYAKYNWVNGVKTGDTHWRKAYKGSIEIMSANYQWDAKNSIWIGKDSLQKLYDGNTNIGSKKYVWENNDWRINEQYDYTFNSHGDYTLKQYSYWKNGVLTPSYKFVYEYDSNWNKTEEQQWNYSDSWRGYSRTKTEYAPEGYVSNLEQYLGWENNNWKGDNKTETTKTTEGNTQKEEVITYDWSSGWVKKERTITAVTTMGQATATEVLVYDWTDKWNEKTRKITVNATNGNKKSTAISTYTWSDKWVGNDSTYQEWTSGNLTEDIKYSWSKDAWVGVSRGSAEWTNGKQTKIIIYKWEGSDWVYSTLDEYKFSGNDETLRAFYKWENGGWIGTGKIETTYAFSGKFATKIEYTWYQDDWFKVKEEINTYSGSLIASELVREWNGTEVANKEQTLYEYGYKNLNTLKVKQTWNGEAWQSADSTKHEKTYITVNSKEKEQSDIQMQWTSSTNKWKGTSRTEYEYDASANQIEKYTYNYSNDDWVYKTRNQNRYKDNNASYPTLKVSWTWSTSDKMWIGSGSKYEYEYDNTNRQVSTARYTWNKSAKKWVGAEKSKEVWENNQKIQTLSYTWNSSKNDWDGMFRHDYQYDAKGHTIEHTQYSYSGGDWVPTTQQLDYFDDVHSTATITENNTWKNNAWCPTKYSETNYDEKAYGGRERFKLDIDYENCTKITKYDYKRYYYQCDQYYTVLFKDADGTELASMEMLQGETPYYDFDVNGTPTREADEQQTYKFKDWDKPLAPATADVTYTAVYTSTPRKYTVTFYNDDHSILTSGAWSYSETPTCAEPSKTGTAQYTYKFLGWGEGIKPVAKDTSYTAVFDTIVNRYAVDFYNEEVRIVRDSVAYGVTPVYSDETPTKAGNAQYTYTFNGWNHALAPVTGDATYKAVFTETVNEYDITFYDEDATTVLESKKCAYGTTPTYTGTTPTKTGDAQYTYTFNGWNPQIVIVSGEASYKAQYSQTLNTYNITFEVKGNPELSYTVPNVEYGTLVYSLVDAVKAALGGETFEDEQYIYTYAGLENVSATTIVEGTATTYYVLYTKTEKQVTPTDVEMIEGREKATKVVIDGVMYIQRDGKLYYVTGAEVR